MIRKVLFGMMCMVVLLLGAVSVAAESYVVCQKAPATTSTQLYARYCGSDITCKSASATSLGNMPCPAGSKEGQIYLEENGHGRKGQTNWKCSERGAMKSCFKSTGGAGPTTTTSSEPTLADRAQQARLDSDLNKHPLDFDKPIDNTLGLDGVTQIGPLTYMCSKKHKTCLPIKPRSDPKKPAQKTSTPTSTSSSITVNGNKVTETKKVGNANYYVVPANGGHIYCYKSASECYNNLGERVTNDGMHYADSTGKKIEGNTAVAHSANRRHFKKSSSLQKSTPIRSVASGNVATRTIAGSSYYEESANGGTLYRYNNPESGRNIYYDSDGLRRTPDGKYYLDVNNNIVTKEFAHKSKNADQFTGLKKSPPATIPEGACKSKTCARTPPTGEGADGETKIVNGHRWIYVAGAWQRVEEAPYSPFFESTTAEPGMILSKDGAEGSVWVRGKDGKWYMLEVTNSKNPITGTSTKNEPDLAGGEFRYGPRDKESGLRQIRRADGLYIKDKNDDGKVDPEEGLSGKIKGVDDGEIVGSVYDKTGQPLGVILKDTKNKDEFIVLFGQNTEKALIVDTKGQVFDLDKENLLGTKLEVHQGKTPNTARFSVDDDGDRKIIDADGKILSEDGRAFENGAWVDESKSDDIFYDRQGNERKGATPDEQGGFYLREKVNGDSVIMHHYANGKVYGESSGIGSLFDSQYYFAQEGKKGELTNIKKYEQCVDAQYCRDPEDSDKIVNGYTGKELTDKQEEELFEDAFGIGSFGWKHFGDAVDTWVGLTSNRYFSVFYSDEETGYYKDLKENEFIGAVLGGIEGVSGALCEMKISDITSSGASFSPTGGSSYAHISAERTTYLNVTDGEPETRYQYLFTMEANPADCPMQLTTWISGSGIRKELILNIPALEKGGETFTFKGPARSKNEYTKVCIKFEDIGTNCLAKVSRGDEACNKIVDARSAYNEYQDVSGESGSGANTGGSGSSGSSGGDGTSPPVINPEI